MIAQQNAKPAARAESPIHFKLARYTAALLLTSLGCFALLGGWLPAMATMCFGLAPLLLYRRSDWSRSASRRDILVTAATLVGAVTLLLGALFLPLPSGEQWIRHPAVVGIFWVTVCCLLAWRWRREHA